MKRIVRLTEQDLVKLVKRVINESDDKLDKLLDILSQYNLPKGKYAIFGSAPLLVSGMIDNINDLDVIVKPKYWPFGNKDSHRTKEIEFFKSWPGFNVNDLINNHSFNYKGFKFINPDKVLDYKKELKRDKDKDIWNLTEGQLIRLVKRVINESDDDKTKLIDLLTSKDIDNVELGLILYYSQGIKVKKAVLDTAKINVLDKFLNKLSDEMVINFAEKLGISDWGQEIFTIGDIGFLWRKGISFKIIRRGHWDKIKDKVLYS